MWNWDGGTKSAGRIVRKGTVGIVTERVGTIRFWKTSIHLNINEWFELAGIYV